MRLSVGFWKHFCMSDGFIGTCSGIDRAQLKGTMWWIYFIMNKAFVWAAHILNSSPESSMSSFELSGQRHHRTDALFSHSSCTSHQRPVTFVLLIVLHFFKGLAGTIGHLQAFMLRKKKTSLFLVLLFTLGAKASAGSHGHSNEQQLELDSNDQLHLADMNVFATYRKGFAHFDWKVGIHMKFTAMKYAKQAHHRE